DADFREYTNAILLAKMMEVCSTTLPQMSIPLVYGDPRYAGHLQRRAQIFEQRGNEAYEIFRDTPGVIVNRPKGAFYFTLVFEDGVLNDRQSLKVENRAVKTLLEDLLRPGVRPDKRFVYYLMAAYGICVTPLSGFHSALPGFRITLLQCDDSKRRATWLQIKKAIAEYLGG
ncbi:MAG: aminotransferase, partial [Planctomycetota bacterium]|nr:aminotransferase [Planctomycetota bacterium]